MSDSMGCSLSFLLNHSARAITLGSWMIKESLNFGVRLAAGRSRPAMILRSEEHTSELQSLMRISYAVFCLKKKTIDNLYSNKYTSSTHRIYRIHTDTQQQDYTPTQQQTVHY